MADERGQRVVGSVTALRNVGVREQPVVAPVVDGDNHAVEAGDGDARASRPARNVGVGCRRCPRQLREEVHAEGEGGARAGVLEGHVGVHHRIVEPLAAAEADKVARERDASLTPGLSVCLSHLS